MSTLPLSIPILSHWHFPPVRNTAHSYSPSVCKGCTLHTHHTAHPPTSLLLLSVVLPVSNWSPLIYLYHEENEQLASDLMGTVDMPETKADTVLLYRVDIRGTVLYR